MKIKEGKDAAVITLKPKETLLILSKNDQHYFLQVTVDEYDDLIFTKRENLKK